MTCSAVTSGRGAAKEPTASTTALDPLPLHQVWPHMHSCLLMPSTPSCPLPHPTALPPKSRTLPSSQARPLFQTTLWTVMSTHTLCA